MSRFERLPVPTSILVAVGLSGLVLVLPLLGVSTFYLGLVISVMLLAIFATSFNLLYGYTGLLSFGHAAYFGISAYTLGLALSGQLDVLPSVFESFFPALLLSVVVASVFAAIFGYFCVQRGDIYFAMLTLAFNMMVYEIVFTWNDFTGGSDGLTLIISPMEILGIEINLLDTVTFYYVSFVGILISFAIMWRIVNSPYGEILMAIRENPERAELIGIHVTRYQLSSFIIAGMFAGFAGALFAVRNFIVTPDMLHWSVSAEPVLMTLLGGPGAFLGPMLGAFLFVALEQVLSRITDYWQFGLGVVLVPIVLFAPGGVMSLLREQADISTSIDPRHYFGDTSGNQSSQEGNKND